MRIASLLAPSRFMFCSRFFSCFLLSLLAHLQVTSRQCRYRLQTTGFPVRHQKIIVNPHHLESARAPSMVRIWHLYQPTAVVENYVWYCARWNLGKKLHSALSGTLCKEWGLPG